MTAREAVPAREKRRTRNATKLGFVAFFVFGRVVPRSLTLLCASHILARRI